MQCLAQYSTDGPREAGLAGGGVRWLPPSGGSAPEPWPQPGPLLPGLQSQARRQPWAAARTVLSLCPRQRAWWSPCTPGPPCTHCCTETGSRWSPGTITPHTPNPTGAVDSALCPPAASGFSKGFSVQLGDLTPPTQTSLRPARPQQQLLGPRAEVSQLLALREALGSHQLDGLGRGGVGGWGRGQGNGQAPPAMGRDVA